MLTPFRQPVWILEPDLTEPDLLDVMFDLGGMDLSGIGTLAIHLDALGRVRAGMLGVLLRLAEHVRHQNKRLWLMGVPYELAGLLMRAQLGDLVIISRKERPARPDPLQIAGSTG